MQTDNHDPLRLCVSILISLVFILTTACAARPVAEPTDTPPPTATATASTTQIDPRESAWHNLEDALHQTPDGNSPAAHLALQMVIRTELQAGAAEDAATRQAALVRLQNVLPVLELPLLLPQTIDTDAQADFVLLAPGLYGYPALAFLSTLDYEAVPLPAADSETEPEFGPAAWASQVRSGDVTADGRAETLLVYTQPGGSGYTERLRIFQWSDASPKLIFQATLINWAGPATWMIEETSDGPPELHLSGAHFGPFTHKLLPHRTRTQVWQWQTSAAQFELQRERVSPPKTHRQQFNVGEVHFRAGRYEEALAAYQQVWLNEQLEAEAMGGGPETDWPALAHLRAGMSLALLNQPAAAVEHLHQAEAAGDSIGELAATFAAAYNGDGALIAAWLAMMQQTDLQSQLYELSGGNLGFPIDAAGLYFPAGIVLAYLNQQPAGSTSDTASLQSSLLAQGLAVSALDVLDLNADRQADVVFVLADDQAGDQTWLAYRGAQGWRIGLLAQRDLGPFAGTRSAPNGGELLLTAGGTLGFAWDATAAQPRLYQLQGDNVLPWPEIPWPVLGGF